MHADGERPLLRPVGLVKREEELRREPAGAGGRLSEELSAFPLGRRLIGAGAGADQPGHRHAGSLQGPAVPLEEPGDFARREAHQGEGPVARQADSNERLVHRAAVRGRCELQHQEASTDEGSRVGRSRLARRAVPDRGVVPPVEQRQGVTERIDGDPGSAGLAIPGEEDGHAIELATLRRRGGRTGAALVAVHRERIAPVEGGPADGAHLAKT